MEPTTIDKVLQQAQTQMVVRSEQEHTPQLSPALQQKMKLVKEQFGDKTMFLTEFNPMAQIKAVKNSDRAFFGKAPTLTLVGHTYGENTPVMWLLAQLFDLCEFTGVKKMDEQQAQYLAEVISFEYSFLKVTELMVFFHRFKMGEYGRFYGSVDPMLILTALKEFLGQREIEIIRHESELRKKEEDEHAKTVVSQEEWCRSYCKKNGYPEMTSMLEVMNYEMAQEAKKVNPPSACDQTS